MIEQRRTAIQQSLAEGEAKRADAVAALAEVERTRAGFAAERDKILADAHDAAERARVAAAADAAKAAASLVAAAQVTIERERAEAEKAWTRAGEPVCRRGGGALWPRAWTGRRCTPRS